MTQTERLSAVNFIQSKCLKFFSSFLSSSAHWINREFRRFLVCQERFFGVQAVVMYKTVSTVIFPIIFITAWLILIQNNMYCWWIEIKKSPEYKCYDNIGDVSVRSFWHHCGTNRKLRVLLRSHYPINDSYSYLYSTVYLAVMVQASWHTAVGNWESKCSYINLWYTAKTS